MITEKDHKLIFDIIEQFNENQEFDDFVKYVLNNFYGAERKTIIRAIELFRIITNQKACFKEILRSKIITLLNQHDLEILKKFKKVINHE